MYDAVVSDLLERGIYPRVLELLRSVPVVVLEGPRASGKTAIGAMLSERGAIRTVVDLSDPTVRRAVEVDVDALLVQPNGDSIPIEVKAATDVRSDDLVGVRRYLVATPGALRGIVFYSGGLTLQLDERIWAVPITALWRGLDESPHGTLELARG